MRLALKNILNGAGGLNPDGLSLDLQFATDKTLTARRGPTPVLTRGSGNNGGTTYFGPLIDITGEGNEFPTSGITNGRAEWSASGGGITWRVFYTGTRWKVEITSSAPLVEYFAATGSEWRPDQANWSGSGTSVITSSTFGIVKAANDEPRFDHDPVSPFACRGLLIEDGRTNLFQRSEEFSNTYWTPTRAPQPTANAAVSPDGATTADKLIADTTAASNHRVDQAAIPLALSTVYTLSIYAKASEYTGIALGVGVSLTRGVDYSLVGSGTATPVSGAGHTGTIQQLANGWYRCTATFTSDATTANHRVAIYVGQNGTTFTYTGDGTSGIFIWGAQLEAGSFATSYIPTTTSTLARSADVCSIANTSPFWNSSEFTVFTNANFVASGVDAYASNFSITAGFFGARRPNTNAAIGIIRSSGVSADINFGSFTTGSMRMALAHSTNQQAGSLNGATAIQQNSAFVPSSNPPLNIGYSGTGAYINGHVLAIRYYKKRLPNAKLQALTA